MNAQTTNHTLRRDQVAELANDMAAAMQAIERLARMVDACNDLQDRSAMTIGIECIAKHAGGLADLVNADHGGVPVVGDFNAWGMPAFLTRDTGLPG